MLDKSTYPAYAKAAAPKSPVGTDIVRAFLAGGAICLLAQVIKTAYLRLGADETVASGATSVTMIFLGALFTGLGLYDRAARFAGAGTIIPITGFANSIVSAAMEFKSEGLVLGMGAKMFTVAGPVLVFGIITSVAIGLGTWIWGVIF